MTELEMKTEVETEEFVGELSDEALDRTEGAYCGGLPSLNFRDGY